MGWEQRGGRVEREGRKGRGVVAVGGEKEVGRGVV